MPALTATLSAYETHMYILGHQLILDQRLDRLPVVLEH